MMAARDYVVVLLLSVLVCAPLFVRAQSLQECTNDFMYMVTHLSDPLYLQMIDYTGKAVDDMGNYDQCKGLPADEAHYCLLRIMIDVGVADEKLPAYVGLCIPSSCDAASTDFLIKFVLTNPQWNISQRLHLETIPEYSIHCGADRETELTVGAIMAIVVMVLVTLLVAGGTYLEQFHVVTVPEDERSLVRDSTGSLVESTGTITSADNLGAPRVTLIKQFHLPLSSFKKSRFDKVREVLKCFAIQSNVKYLFYDNRPSEPTLACLNGLRSLMMAWVIIGHSFTYLASPVGFDNLSTVQELIGRVSFQITPSAELSVDVFFYMSGFLVVYMLLKEMKAKHGRIPWGLFYFHRYWRLTPIYGFIILVYTTLTPFFVRGPFSYMYRPQKTDLCDSYWWTNLLYLNNFYPTSSDQQCMGWSWYLANDMQFYIFTPVIVLLYRKNKRLGWILAASLIAISMSLNSFLTYHYTLDVLNPDNNQYNSIIYNKPYTRMGPYLIGIIVAFMVQETHIDLAANRLLRWGSYILCGSVTTMATYLIYNYWRHGWNLLQNVMYMTFARVGFVMAVGWVMYTMHKGHGGILRWFLSMYFWVPLARLTYIVYLVHPIVIFIVNFSATTPFHWSALYGGIRYVANLAFAYSIGFVLFLAVEKPTANLERVLIPRGKH